MNERKDAIRTDTWCSKDAVVRTSAHVRNVWRNHSCADSGEQLF